MIQRRSSAEKTRRLPSGEGRAPRICRTVSTESLTGYSKRTSSPSFWSTVAVNGISVCFPLVASTLQIFPWCARISALESGVQE